MTVDSLNGLALRIAKEQKLRVWIDKECEIAASCGNEGHSSHVPPLIMYIPSHANTILVPSFLGVIILNKQQTSLEQ